MKIKFTLAVIALCCTFSLPVAHADTAPVQAIPLSIDAITGDATGFFGGTHSGTGSFNDVFNFTPASVGGLTTALLSSFNIFGNGVTFNSASLNGVSLIPAPTINPVPGVTVFGMALGAQPFTGPLQLLVNGNSMGTINSYTGSLYVTSGTPIPPPVPEPETYAMMLAGLGLLGFAAHRKAKASQS
ncbi:MAG: hypothetical protein ACI9ZF_002965 [Bradyrhizobium sp.]|jgi:hypothetical protein